MYPSTAGPEPYPGSGCVALFALDSFLRCQIQNTNPTRIASPTTGPITAPTIQTEDGDPEILAVAVAVAQDDTISDDDIAAEAMR